MRQLSARSLFSPLLALGLAAALAACSGGGAKIGLAPGLTAQMDAQGASLDQAAALDLVNQYRRSVGAAPVAGDAGLDATARQLAAQYAQSGTPPRRSADLVSLRASAGYTSFAETFSGWRNSAPEAAGLAVPARRAGIGVVHAPNSTYGTYWIIVLAQ